MHIFRHSALWKRELFAMVPFVIPSDNIIFIKFSAVHQWTLGPNFISKTVFTLFWWSKQTSMESNESYFPRHWSLSSDALKVIDMKVLPINNHIPLRTNFSCVSQECLVKLKCTGLINGEMTESFSWHIFYVYKPKFIISISKPVRSCPVWSAVHAMKHVTGLDGFENMPWRYFV